MTPNPAELLDVALAAVRPAGEIALEMRRTGIGPVTAKSTDTDVVTGADRAVEAHVTGVLKRLRPDDGVLGEEGGSTTGTGRVRWVLDPIDGTVNYLYRLPQYAVSLAAEVDGEVVAAVVRNPATREEWTAVRGAGAWRDGNRLRCSSISNLGQCLVATGFAYDPAVRAEQGRVVAGLLPRVRDIRRFGAAAIDLCRAAEGAVDAYYERGLSPWDQAAGGLVALEAGLLVTGLNGAPAGPELVLAANPAIHAQLNDLLAELRVLRAAS